MITMEEGLTYEIYNPVTNDVEVSLITEVDLDEKTGQYLGHISMIVSVYQKDD